jgi:hypothetical protein
MEREEVREMSEIVAQTQEVKTVKSLKEVLENKNTRFGFQVNEKYAISVKHVEGKYGSKYVITFWRTMIVRRMWWVNARTKVIGNVVLYRKEDVEDFLKNVLKINVE